MTLQSYFGLPKPLFPKTINSDALFVNSANDHVLKRMSFALERDTIALLVAKSGCGKTISLVS